MIKVKKPILLKLIFRIGLPLLLIYCTIIFFTYQQNKQASLKNTKQYLTELSNHNAAKLDKEFTEISHSSYAIKNFIESLDSISEKELFAFTKNLVESDKDNIGAGVAFLPYKFRQDKENYAVFTHKKNEQYLMEDLSSSYNYLNEDWFSIPLILQKEYWTEPFWGKLSEKLLMVNTVPIFSNKEIIGISFADISLEIVSELSNENNIMNGYTFIISKQGTFIYHPKSQYVMKETIFSLAEQFNKDKIRELGQRMINGESGIESYQDLQNQEKNWIVYTPIKSTGWSFAAVISEQAILASVQKRALKQFWILLIGLILILSIIVLVARSFSNPLNKLAGAAKEISEGKLDTEIANIQGKDEIAELGLIFNKMVKDLNQHLNELTTITKAKEAVESEMRIARKIQESLLPRIFPAFPERPEFDLYAENIAAKEVAGDFYDFFFLDEKNLAFLIADVSGKGISAGLFMAVTRTLLKTVCDTDTPPEKALDKANAILCQDNDACMFTTLFLGYFNIETGEVNFSNAGHDYPYIISSQNKLRVLETKQDIALGIDETHSYQAGKMNLQEDEIFCLYTDGVLEATSENNELYGEERFISFLEANADNTLQKIVKDACEDLMIFQKNIRFDDITMLLLKRNKRRNL